MTGNINPDSSMVRYEKQEAVATITLDRPSRLNAIDGPGWKSLRECADDAANDSSIRMLKIRGAEGNFCSGADVQAARQAVHPLGRMRMITDTVRTIFDLPIPTVAIVEGVAVGAGWNLALACDFIVCTEEARFSQIFARRGLSVDCGGSWLLPRLVGMQQAKRLLYLAEMISANEARDLGLVLKVVGAESLENEVGLLTEKLVSAPPTATRLNKELLNSSWTTEFHEQLLKENMAQTINFGTDAPIARAAIEKGDVPNFQGEWQL